MATVIRLKRIGTNKKPCFRIVVTDKGSPRDGRFIEELGYYEPAKRSDNVTLDAQKIRDWISKGAVPSDTVKSLLKKASKSK